MPQTITLVSTATDNALQALHGLEGKSELVRGCYMKQEAGKKKSASGMADASSCLYPNCEFSSEQKLQSEKEIRPICLFLSVFMLVTHLPHLPTLCVVNNWKEF